MASSEALSAAFAEPETETTETVEVDAAEVDAVNEAVAEDAPAAETDEAPVQEQAEPTVSEPAVVIEEPSVVAEEPLAVTATAQTLDEEAPEQHSDSTAGVTEAGRAVNDPRIAPKPVRDTSVSTELGELFATPEAPPVTVVQQDVSRARNDPRGPRAA